MTQHFPLMIPGADNSGDVLEVKAPFDQSLIAIVDTADVDAVEQALNTAHTLFKEKSAWLALEKRIDILEKAAVLMQERFDELAIGAAREGGKPLVDSRVEVARAIDGMKLCVEHLRTNSGKEIPMNLNAASSDRLAFTTKEPIGVVVAISAFNHPLNLIVHQVAPAIATGCPVIVKPAEDTPLSCFRFVQILREAGLPDEWCQALTVNNSDIALELVTDNRVAFLSFIGSARVGWMLRSKLAPGTRCALEHGGVAPVIVAEDADIDAALPLLGKGGFYHAGQVCVSVQKIFCHESIAMQVAEGLVEIASKLVIDDPVLLETEVGPLIRPAEVDRVAQWVALAVNDGAVLMCGGKKIFNTCYECTVLYDPPDDSIVSQKEIFGPVVMIYPYKNINDAIQRANVLPFSFQASVFSKNIDTLLYASKHLDASAVMMNDHTAFRVDWMPFSGLKQSGLGTGGIPYTMDDMQTDKLLVFRL